MNKLLIYGAYGYTGRLIVDECLEKGMKPLVAGRDAEKMKAFATKKDLEYEVFEVNQKSKLEKWLSKGDVVIHCGGPFIHTAKQMIEGCLATQTHYTDITGEYQVFDMAQTYSEEAKSKGLMLLPGAGFDVVPSDCLAAHLHEKLPDAVTLELAFMSQGGRLSRGTTKTMIENMGDPQVIRKDGEYAYQIMGVSNKIIDFGESKSISIGITWGDISTAFFSTGIPNIEVFTGTTNEQLAKVKRMGKISFLLKSKMVKNFLKNMLDKKPDGPSEERRQGAQMMLWGKVSNGKKEVEARLSTPNGYTLTAITSVLIVEKIMSGMFKPGFQTPSSAYGKNLILEVDGCELK